ncbi:MAG: DUF664 domain-containing protein [Nitriliruptorales bacterium]|nr:DUF664 domain-containing protein [Nitriliruptorales bacterium]
MRLNEALISSFEQIRSLVHGTVQGLDARALAWRPDPQANPIAWLVWHLTRVQDDHVSEIGGREQLWVAEGWPERFGLPGDLLDTGYGHSPDQVAAVHPGNPGVLLEYQDRVAHMTKRYLEGLDSGDFDRVIDGSYDPPVTVGVRLMSVNSDALQHVGQAAYVRGLWERGA